jgi:hypothetical protein
MDIEHEIGRRFRAGSEERPAVLEYALEDGRMRITHTLVDPSLRGQGVAGELARAAFDYARDHGLRVFAQCEYARAWAGRHHEYSDLLDEA